MPVCVRAQEFVDSVANRAASWADKPAELRMLIEARRLPFWPWGSWHVYVKLMSQGGHVG